MKFRKVNIQAGDWGTMERGSLLKRCEEIMRQSEQLILQAAKRQDSEAIEAPLADWIQAQGNWLVVARGMSSEKSQGVVMGLIAAGGGMEAMTEGRGPLPSALTLYDGPLSDEEFLKQAGERDDWVMSEFWEDE